MVWVCPEFWPWFIPFFLLNLTLKGQKCPSHSCMSFPQWCCPPPAAGEPEVPQSADQLDAGGRWRSGQKHSGESCLSRFIAVIWLWCHSAESIFSKSLLKSFWKAPNPSYDTFTKVTYPSVELLTTIPIMLQQSFKWFGFSVIFIILGTITNQGLFFLPKGWSQAL